MRVGVQAGKKLKMTTGNLKDCTDITLRYYSTDNSL